MNNQPLTKIAYEQPPYILLIDDDEDDLEMLSFSLGAFGIKIRSFSSSEKAIHYLKFVSDVLELPSLIILDYNMPKFNGGEILALIKNSKNISHIPIVMYSTNMPPVFKKMLQDLGAFDCFMKPYTYLDFTTQVGVFKELAYSFTTKKTNL